MIDAENITTDRNIILAAIPRSGSTLACHLLNQRPNTLAMVELMDMAKLQAQTGEAARVEYISSYIQQTRKKIQDSGTVPQFILKGGSTNTFSMDSQKARKSSIAGTEWIKPSQSLTHNFTLILKHPNAFSALLGELKRPFTCYAMIRNPLACLASWNTLDHPLSDGHAPMAEVFDQDLRKKLAACQKVIERQLILLDWYFQQYYEQLAIENIIMYEQVIATQGKILSRISASKYEIEENLQCQNNSKLYNQNFVELAANALEQDDENHCWRFYQKAEVQQLATNCLTSDST